MVDNSALPPQWINNIRLLANIRLKAASLQAMNLIGVIPLFIQVGDLKVRVWLEVIKYLALSAIIGPYFIVCFLQAILPADEKIIPRNSRAFVILATSTYG